jgi:[ribosomal protein S5]-alanine N-acetyltransferase
VQDDAMQKLTLTPSPSLDGITLQTKRLTLRPFLHSDAPFILALFSDKGFMEYASAPMFKSIEEADALVVRDAAKRAAGARLRLGIERNDNGALIGYCDLFNIDRGSHKGEIGFGLSTNERGLGFMNEALSAFLHCAFHELDFNRIMADLNPENTKSEKTVKRLGFTKEGHFRENCIVNGVISDSVFYGLLKRDKIGT